MNEPLRVRGRGGEKRGKGGGGFEDARRVKVREARVLPTMAEPALSEQCFG